MDRYGFFCFLSRLVLRIFFRIEVFGLENIPGEGPFILAPNHVSFLDPPAAGAFIRRRMYYMARKSLFDIPLLGGLISWCNAFPVSRGGGSAGALRRALAVLREGHGLLLFPEGGRSTDGRLKDADPGVGLLSSAAGAPVVPALISGTEKALPANARFIRFAKIRVHYLEPVLPPEDGGREAYSEIAGKVMESIREKMREAGQCPPR